MYDVCKTYFSGFFSRILNCIWLRFVNLINVCKSLYSIYFILYTFILFYAYIWMNYYLKWVRCFICFLFFTTKPSIHISLSLSFFSQSPDIGFQKLPMTPGLPQSSSSLLLFCHPVPTEYLPPQPFLLTFYFTHSLQGLFSLWSLTDFDKGGVSQFSCLLCFMCFCW